MARPRTSATERFLTKIEILGEKECWPWLASVNRADGYGRFRDDEQQAVGAHRFAYRLWRGVIPEGMTVMHLCDNPICVNPTHLRSGTQTENMADRDAKGRGRPWGMPRKVDAGFRVT